MNDCMLVRKAMAASLKDIRTTLGPANFKGAMVCSQTSCTKKSPMVNRRWYSTDTAIPWTAFKARPKTKTTSVQYHLFGKKSSKANAKQCMNFGSVDAFAGAIQVAQATTLR